MDGLFQQTMAVAQRQGLDFGSEQPSYRNVYDGVVLGAGTHQKVTLFQNVRNHVKFQTNLQNNSFQVGETLQMLALSFTSNLNAAPSTVDSRLIYGNTAFIEGFFDLTIGNQVVLKKIPLSFQESGVGKISINGALGLFSAMFYLESPIVILPQLDFSIDIYGFNITVPEDQELKIQGNILGLAKLFNGNQF